MIERAPRRGARVAAIVTILAGIVPLVIFSARSNTLWFGSRIDVPLIAVPSVWIGDSFFLPILNYYIVAFLRACLSDNRRNLSAGAMSRVVAVSMAVSFCISGYTHYMWTQDQYLGFIDPSFGVLSMAGRWHFIFAWFEMTLVLVFISVWAIVGKRSQDQFAYRAWRVFIGYAFLSIADFLILHLVVLPARNAGDYKLYTGWQGLLVIPFWYTVRVFVAFFQRERSHSGATARNLQ